MAITFAHHGQLTASTPTPVDLARPYVSVEVVNRDGTAEIYFTVGNPNSAAPVPAVGADDTYVVPAAMGSYVVDDFPGGVSHVRLISSGTPLFSVVGQRSE